MSRRDITCAKIRKIINNSAGDCSISLKFRTYFDHVTLDEPQTFKVNRSKVKVTAWHNVPASKNAIIQLLKVKLGENYPRAI